MIIIKDSFKVIRAKDAPTYMDKSSSLIVVDTNKDYLIHSNIKGILPILKNIIVIDHHKIDNNTIKINNLFIDESLSSTCF